ncbi:MAG: type II secretion system F family protein [Solirubrobacterales bacterium]|nr:type II secretion system F family protein [Solirubrobacterales bacterium]MCB8969926.1 type II secretion system F family protein [Thermoleophilales bacterium]MCO5328073.1 type II secretion system F family protein [Solirubrobacterales bacterium]
MSVFLFRAVDLAGVPSRGELEAGSKTQVTEQLRQRGLIVLDVSEKREAMRIDAAFDRFRRIDMRELAVFSRQFATLIGSGMPMLRSLYTLEDQTQDEKIKEAIGGLRNDVEAGSSVADAMERRPGIFDPLYRSMVRAGEGSGRLESALDMVAIQLEKLDALRRQVKSAMMYPLLVFTFAALVMMAVVAFIVPVFVGLFEELAAESGDEASLPVMTQITVSASDAITGYWFILFPAMAGLFFAFAQWKKTERGRYQWDSFKLKLPAKIGDVVQKVAIARWSRVFSGTISAGVPILQAVKIAGETSGNAVVAEAMEDVYASVRRGGTIAAPLDKSAVFPTMVTHMVAVGEETGQLEHMLSKVADFYEAEVDAKVKALTSLIEPIMIIFVGIAVGFIVISMYLPIFSIYDKIK